MLIDTKTTGCYFISPGDMFLTSPVGQSQVAEYSQTTSFFYIFHPSIKRGVAIRDNQQASLNCSHTGIENYIANYLGLLYCKNIGGEKLANLANYSISPSFFANFHNFHNIPYASGLQFAKVFFAKLPTVLIRQSF